MSYADRGRCTLAVIVAVIALSGGRGYGQPNPYQTIENYFKLPAGRTMGATAGVEIDRDGTSIWLFERCGAPNRLSTPTRDEGTCVGSNLDPILKFDSSGKVVKSFGAGMFVYPHGIYLDRDGNVWVTDAPAS